MERIWLSHYPPGIPAEVNVHEFSSLRDVLLRSCQRFGDFPAYSNMGASMTYAELDRASRNFAAYLQKSVGLHKGDRAAIMMPNLLQYPVALFGVLRAGLVVVNVNPQYTAPELAHQHKDSGAAAIVVRENFAPTLQQVLEKNPALKPAVITTEVGDLFPVVKELVTSAVVKYVKHMVPAWKIAGATEFNAALRTGHGQEVEIVPLGHDDTACLQYTGGTTGVAKGAVLTHGNIVAKVQQLRAWIALDLVDGKEVFICPLPLYHVYALTSSLVFLSIGAHTVLVTDPRDLNALIHELKKYPFTMIIGVNTLYRALLDAPEFADVDTHTLKLTSAGGMGFVDARGYFKITDRKKDMIIVVKRDAALTEQALLDHCQKHLTGCKVPRIIEFRSEPLPKSNVGKILRRQLREAPAPNGSIGRTGAAPLAASNDA